MAQPSLDACLKVFCSDFRSFSSSLEKNCKDLRRAVSEKGHSYVDESNFSSLLDDLNSQFETVEAEVSSLEASTVDTISVAELLGHCNELYLQNESAIQQLEVHLEQYGYTPVQLPPSGNIHNGLGLLSKPSPYATSESLRTPSWGSGRKTSAEGASERLQSSSNGRPPLPSSNASTPGERDAVCTSPSRDEESTLELRRDILGQGVSRPPAPPSPGSPECLSLADLGLSASSLEAIRDDGGHEQAPTAPTGRDLPSSGQGISKTVHFECDESQLSSSSFETPRPSAHPPSLSPPSASIQIPQSLRPPEEEGKADWPVSSISVRQRDKKPPISSAAGDSLFPLAEPVTQAELDTVPFFLRAQVSLQDLNGAIQKINDSVTDKRFSEQDAEQTGSGTDCITQDELAVMNLGPRLKAYLLLLVRLDRVVTKHVAGATVYALQAGPSKH